MNNVGFSLSCAGIAQIYPIMKCLISTNSFVKCSNYSEKDMRRISILFILVITASCGSQPVMVKTVSPDIEALSRFFAVFEKDLENTTRVIAEQELVKNLSHLQRMNFGGQKYYPLEREALTKMIRELASYNYAECVLTNLSGTIIYTMYDNTIFSKNATSYTSTFAILFNHGKEGPYILDVIEFPKMSKRYLLFFAMPVVRNGATEGVLMAAVKSDDIVRIAKIKGSAVDNDGIVKVSADNSKVLLPYEGEVLSAANAFHFYGLEWILTGK
jgi:hypothetical protein